ncbi:riboflavin synthase subunit alpha, partial [Glaesserella parasuis]
MTENIEPYLQPQKRRIIADKDKEQQLLKMAKEHYTSYADVAKFADALNLRAGIVYLTLKYHGFVKQTETTQYRVLDSYYRHNGDLKEITKDVGLTVWIVAKTLEQ